MNPVIRYTVPAMLLFVLLVPRLDAAQVGMANPIGLELTEVDKHNVTVALPDGSRLIGGHLGSITSGCPTGTQAFVRREKANGTTMWIRHANAGNGDCSGTGSGGASLFEGVTSVDPSFIIASTVSTAFDVGNGDVYVAVSSLLAWKTSPEADLAATWGLLLIHTNRQGNHISDRYFGAQPSGLTVTGSQCDLVCVALAAEHDQYSATTITTRGDDIWLTGWFRPKIAEGHFLTDKDLLVIRVAKDLSVVHAISTPAFDGNDVGMAITVDRFGIAWVTGFYGTLRDFFVASFLPNGNLYRAYVAGGPFDDWGDDIQLTENDTKVVVEGHATDWATFGDLVVGEPGFGQIDFLASFDRNLALQSLETSADPDPSSAPGRVQQIQPVGACGLGSLGTPAGLPPGNAPATGPTPHRDMSGPHVYHPTALEVTEGEAGSGTAAAVAGSDDCYLSLNAKLDPADEAAEAIYELPLMDEAPVPHTVSLEFRSEYCSSVEISLGGGTAVGFVLLDVVDICPLDEPKISLEVPAATAATLGFVPGAPVSQMPPLLIKTRFVMHGAPCVPDPTTMSCTSSGGKDCDVDDVSATSDYGT